MAKAAESKDKATIAKVKALNDYEQKRIAEVERNNAELLKISREAMEMETNLKKNELELIKEEATVAKTIQDTLKANG